jgi:DtxR family Mn-dependent transcriptional regulator
MALGSEMINKSELATQLAAQATQDYVKAIYELCCNEGRATTGRIAEKLEVTPASVTGMLKKLSSQEPPLVQYRRHQGVLLTAEGERLALEMIRQHRLLECFLHEALGYRWDEVHDEAERLEHAVSEALTERIAQWLEHPEHDPHGDPIPSRELELPAQETVPLDELQPGQEATISHVYDRDPELLRYLEELELKPQLKLKVLPPLPFSDHVRVQCHGQEREVIVSAAVAQHISVLTGEQAA